MKLFTSSKYSNLLPVAVQLPETRDARLGGQHINVNRHVALGTFDFVQKRQGFSAGIISARDAQKETRQHQIGQQVSDGP